MFYYAGIGSRETPKEFLDLFTRVAKYLSKKNCVLRSGGAKGSDKAFELGTIYKEIFLPWKGFEGSNSNLVVQDGKGNGGTGQALRIAKDYNIPIFDCGKYSDVRECAKELKRFLDKILEELNES